jgi:hypothetical protein
MKVSPLSCATVTRESLRGLSFPFGPVRPATLWSVAHAGLLYLRKIYVNSNCSNERIQNPGERHFARTVFVREGKAKPNQRRATKQLGEHTGESVHNRPNETGEGHFPVIFSNRSEHSLRVFVLPFRTIITKVSYRLNHTLNNKPKQSTNMPASSNNGRNGGGRKVNPKDVKLLENVSDRIVPLSFSEKARPFS